MLFELRIARAKNPNREALNNPNRAFSCRDGFEPSLVHKKFDTRIAGNEVLS